MPCYIVAEGGINHRGDMDVAGRMTEAAANAGANAIKWQKRHIPSTYDAAFLDSPRESPWGTTQREQKEGLELSVDEHRALQVYANDLGLDCSWSCWDETSLAEMAALKPPWLKVASPILGDVALLRAQARTGIPLIVSTGMADRSEIYGAIGYLVDTWRSLHPDPGDSGWDCRHLRAVLHCTSSYPCPDDEINLRGMLDLFSEFGAWPEERDIRPETRIPVGYSGHERGIATTVAAVALGAEVVERHLTLDRTMYGSDQAASLEPGAFRRMVRDIRAVEAAMGDGVLRVMPSEVDVRAKLRRG